MPWSYNCNDASGIIEVYYKDVVTASDLQEANSACIALAKETGINKFVVDAAGMILRTSIVNILKLPAEQYVAEGADRSIRVAVIFPESAREKEAVQFYETVCQNRGWTVKACRLRQDALDWLDGKE